MLDLGHIDYDPKELIFHFVRQTLEALMLDPDVQDAQVMEEADDVLELGELSYTKGGPGAFTDYVGGLFP